MGLFFGNNIVPFAASNIKYGRLYNWHAASNALFAPSGWHVPTDTELTTLTTYLTDNGYGYGGSGSDIAKSMSITYGWAASAIAGHIGNDQLSNNSSEFSAKGSGLRFSNGAFDVITQYGYLWSATAFDSEYIWGLGLYYNGEFADITTIYLNDGYSCRLIKDNSSSVPSLTDLDGNIYRTIKIGDQVWLADNWACTKLNDGTPIPNVTVDLDWAALTTLAYCNYDNDINNVFI